jgi:hypothetical protein
MMLACSDLPCCSSQQRLAPELKQPAALKQRQPAATSMAAMLSECSTYNFPQPAVSQ